jgi:hypothetical protein
MFRPISAERRHADTRDASLDRQTARRRKSDEESSYSSQSKLHLRTVYTHFDVYALTVRVEPPPHRSNEKFNMGSQAKIWSRMPPYATARTSSLA